jgi:predicted transcriptional regulator
MPTTLTVPVSDALLARLKERAAERDTTPEAVAAECLDRAFPPPGEFLRRWAGSVESGVPDAGLRHDDYLGQAIYDEMTGGRGPDDVR